MTVLRAEREMLGGAPGKHSAEESGVIMISFRQFNT